MQDLVALLQAANDAVCGGLKVHHAHLILAAARRYERGLIADICNVRTCSIQMYGHMVSHYQPCAQDNQQELAAINTCAACASTGMTITESINVVMFKNPVMPKHAQC